MNTKPKYLLISQGRKVESTDLEAIMKLAKNIPDYYEIYKCLTSGMKAEKKLVTSKSIESAVSMKSRGYSINVIMNCLKLPKSIVEKILFENT